MAMAAHAEENGTEIQIQLRNNNGYETQSTHPWGEDEKQGTPDELREDKGVTVDELLEHVGDGVFQTRLLVVCSMAFCADAFEVTLLSFLQICAQDDWDLSDTASSSITAAVFAGELLGAVLWGPAADHWGRRSSFIASCLVITVFGFLTTLAMNVWWLLALRAFVGFGVGGLFVPYDLLAEFIRSERRGRVLIYIQYAWTVGSVFVVVMAWALLGPTGWRGLAAVCTLPVLASLAAAPLIPESPRWLLSKGRVEEAMDVLRMAAKVNGNSLPTGVVLKQDDHGVYDEGLGNIRELFLPGLRKITVPVWTVWFGFGLTYYGVVLLNARLFGGDDPDKEALPATCSFDYPPMIMVASAEVAGTALAAAIIDPVGRSRSQGLTYLVSALTVLAAALAPAEGLMTGLSFLARSFIMAASSISWVQAPELYPSEVRASGHGWANAMSRLGGFVSPYWVDSKSLSLLTVSVGLAVVMIISGAAAMVLPETAGRDLDTGTGEDEPTAGELAMGTLLGVGGQHAHQSPPVGRAGGEGRGGGGGSG